MTNGDKVKRDANGRTSLVAALIAACLGSAGGIGIFLGTPIAQSVTRPDPFTGSQAVALETRIDHIEGEVRRHLGNHPDQTNRFDRRISVLETQINLILQNQQRILQKLDAQ